MDRPMTVGASVRYREAGAVVMAGMALQAKRGLADAEQICVRRTVRRVAGHAVFGDRRMLVGKRSAILCVAAEAELICVRGAKIVSAGSSMRIMAVGALHLSFAQRVMVWHAHLRPLALVASQAGVIGLPVGLDNRLGFRHNGLDRIDARWSQYVDIGSGFQIFCIRIMRLMAINATHVVRGVFARHPVPDTRLFRVAAQANSIALVGRAVGEGNDLCDIPPAVNVQAPGAMTFLALHSLLRVIGMAKIFGDI